MLTYGVTMSIDQARRAIRYLLDSRNPGDALGAYYAYHHDNNRTHLATIPTDSSQSAEGYIATSRTGIDLFRPLLTMRLPIHNLEASAQLLRQALPPANEAFVICPITYDPIVRAIYEVRTEQTLAIYMMDKAKLQAEINVLVTREDKNQLPRFVIKQMVEGHREAVAAAGLNWQSPHFAEIAVRTHANYRRRGLGRSVVTALAQHIFNHGRTPLYAVALDNQPSIDLARRVGFHDTGYRQLMLEVRARG